MNLALYLHTAGVGGILGTLVIAGLIIWLVFYVIPLPPIVRTILGVVVAVALILLLLPGCGTADTAFRSRVSGSTTTVGVTHKGDVGVTESLTFRDPSKDL